MQKQYRLITLGAILALTLSLILRVRIDWFKLPESTVTGNVSEKGMVYAISQHTTFLPIVMKNYRDCTMVRISQSIIGGDANGMSYDPAISSDGSFISFTSDATNLILYEKYTHSDIYVHSIYTAETDRKSVSLSGYESWADSSASDISADGNTTAFATSAINLVHDETYEQHQVYIRQFAAGVEKTLLVSLARYPVASGYGEAGNGYSTHPSISDNGHIIAYESTAPDLVANDTNGHPDIFIRNMAGWFSARISLRFDGGNANGSSSNPSISADGCKVAFQSEASNIVLGDGNAASDIFVYDCLTKSNTRVSVHTNGAEGNKDSYYPAISADGNYVAFQSNSTNLSPNDLNNVADIFVHNLITGVTERVSLANIGVQGNDMSFTPDISSDGRFVVFVSSANNLTDGDTNLVDDVFVRDRLLSTTIRVSESRNREQANSGSYDPEISDDGRFVVFTSSASDLVQTDNNMADDVFLTCLHTK